MHSFTTCALSRGFRLVLVMARTYNSTGNTAALLLHTYQTLRVFAGAKATQMLFAEL